MKCERCDSLATEHVIFVHVGELHLCSDCAASEPEVIYDWAAARLNWPPERRRTNAHDFLKRWVKFNQVHGREPTYRELTEILRALRKDEGSD